MRPPRPFRPPLRPAGVPHCALKEGPLPRVRRQTRKGTRKRNKEGKTVKKKNTSMDSLCLGHRQRIQGKAGPDFFLLNNSTGRSLVATPGRLSFSRKFQTSAFHQRFSFDALPAQPGHRNRSQADRRGRARVAPFGSFRANSVCGGLLPALAPVTGRNSGCAVRVRRCAPDETGCAPRRPEYSRVTDPETSRTRWRLRTSPVAPWREFWKRCHEHRPEHRATSKKSGRVAR